MPSLFVSVEKFTLLSPNKSSALIGLRLLETKFLLFLFEYDWIPLHIDKVLVKFEYWFNKSKVSDVGLFFGVSFLDSAVSRGNNSLLLLFKLLFFVIHALSLIAI